MYPLNVPLPYPPYVLPVYNSYHGICRDLGQMIRTWTTAKKISGQHLPLIFTEDNWNNNPEFPTDHQHIYCGDPFGCQGAYLADLFTWLYDHRTVYSTTDPATSPLRIAWYRGANKVNAADQLLGLYTISGHDNRLDGGSGTTPGIGSSTGSFPNYLTSCQRVHRSFLNDLYTALRNTGCY